MPPSEEERPSPPTPEDNRRYVEQTWFATATGALNGFLLNGMQSIGSLWLVKPLSLLFSVYAVFLVLQRSADAEGEFKKKENEIADLPGETRSERKWRETKLNLRVVRRHLPFVLRECSGALFYVLLIAISCLAVLFAHPHGKGWWHHPVPSDCSVGKKP
jgi:hypothetical protein